MRAGRESFPAFVRQRVEAAGRAGSSFTFSMASSVAIPKSGVIYVDIPVYGLPRKPRAVTTSIHVHKHSVETLALTLGGPDGRGALLSAFHGDRATAYGSSPDAPTVFDDDAELSIVEALPPFAGVFRPVQPIARLLGGLATPNGLWHLIVSDAEGTPGGRLVHGTITFQF
jgi:hypothetical protein